MSINKQHVATTYPLPKEKPTQYHLLGPSSIQSGHVTSRVALPLESSLILTNIAQAGSSGGLCLSPSRSRHINFLSPSRPPALQQQPAPAYNI
jgi:hypothetical protein